MPESARLSKISGGLAFEADCSGGLGQNYNKEILKVRLSFKKIRRTCEDASRRRWTSFIRYFKYFRLSPSGSGGKMLFRLSPWRTFMRWTRLIPLEAAWIHANSDETVNWPNNAIMVDCFPNLPCTNFLSPKRPSQVIDNLHFLT